MDNRYIEIQDNTDKNPQPQQKPMVEVQDHTGISPHSESQKSDKKKSSKNRSDYRSQRKKNLLKIQIAKTLLETKKHLKILILEPNS